MEPESKGLESKTLKSKLEEPEFLVLLDPWILFLFKRHFESINHNDVTGNEIICTPLTCREQVPRAESEGGRRRVLSGRLFRNYSRSALNWKSWGWVIFFLILWVQAGVKRDLFKNCEAGDVGSWIKNLEAGARASGTRPQ